MASHSASDVAEAVAAMYRAALEPAEWSTALERFRGLFGAAAGAIFIQDRVSGEIPVFFGVGTEGGEQEYIEHIKDINPRTPVALTKRPGDVIVDADVHSERAMDRDPFYDWLSRTHGYRYFIGSRLYDDGALSGFASVDWDAKQGHARLEQIELFRMLVPHLSEALRLGLRCEAASLEKAALDEAVHVSGCALVVLDRDGRAAYMNAGAERILSRQDGLGLRNGALFALKAADSRGLNAAIAEVLRHGADEAVPRTRTCVVDRRGSRRPYCLTISPAPAGPALSVAGIPGALVLIRDLAPRGISQEILRRVFGLTRREAQIAAALERGMTVAQAAAHMGISINTARTHLKAVFRKADVDSQAQLSAVLGRMPPEEPGSA